MIDIANNDKSALFFRLIQSAGPFVPVYVSLQQFFQGGEVVEGVHKM